MLWVLLVVILIAALFAFPAWPYSRGWGYNPFGALLAIVLLLLILALVF